MVLHMMYNRTLKTALKDFYSCGFQKNRISILGISWQLQPLPLRISSDCEGCGYEYFPEPEMLLVFTATSLCAFEKHFGICCS